MFCKGDLLILPFNTPQPPHDRSIGPGVAVAIMMQLTTGNPGVNAYTNDTLVSNWWEDRYIPPGLKLTSSDRVFAMDLTMASTATATARGRSGALPVGLPAAPGQLAATTKLGMDEGMLGSMPVAKLRKPSLFNSNNMDERLQAYGNPETLHYTLKGTEVCAVHMHVQCPPLVSWMCVHAGMQANEVCTQ